MRLQILVLTGVAIIKVANGVTDFDYLVSFGDSYTQNGIGASLNEGPIPGVYHPVTSSTASGGLNWGDAVQVAVPGLTYYDYAIGGATCSSELIDNGSIKLVMQTEIPIFQADWKVSQISGMYKTATAKNTVFALWIGTNDLHHSTAGFFTEKEPDSSYLYGLVECYWRWIDAVYKMGGRRFVVFTPPPLHLAPMPEMKEPVYRSKVLQYGSSVTRMTLYGASYEVSRQRWPRASVKVFDTFKLLTDISNNGTKYLEIPANVNGYYTACNGKCVYNINHYMWFNTLHPSNKTHSIVAQEFINAFTPDSKYTTTFGVNY